MGEGGRRKKKEEMKKVKMGKVEFKEGEMFRKWELEDQGKSRGIRGKRRQGRNEERWLKREADQYYQSSHISSPRPRMMLWNICEA